MIIEKNFFNEDSTLRSLKPMDFPASWTNCHVVAIGALDSLSFRDTPKTSSLIIEEWSIYL